jgi:hypothetical protein
MEIGGALQAGVILEERQRQCLCRRGEQEKVGVEGFVLGMRRILFLLKFRVVIGLP